MSQQSDDIKCTHCGGPTVLRTATHARLQDGTPRSFFKCEKAGYTRDQANNSCDRFFLWLNEAPLHSAGPLRQGGHASPPCSAVESRAPAASPLGRPASQQSGQYLQPKPSKEVADAVRCPHCSRRASLAKVTRENGNHGRWFYSCQCGTQPRDFFQWADGMRNRSHLAPLQPAPGAANESPPPTAGPPSQSAGQENCHTSTSPTMLQALASSQHTPPGAPHGHGQAHPSIQTNAADASRGAAPLQHAQQTSMPGCNQVMGMPGSAPAGRPPAISALTARRRAQSAQARQDIHGTHVARPGAKTSADAACSGVGGPALPGSTTMGAAVRSSLSGADCVPPGVPPAATAVAADASQIPHTTQCFEASGGLRTGAGPSPVWDASQLAGQPLRQSSQVPDWAASDSLHNSQHPYARAPQNGPGNLAQSPEWKHQSQELVATQLQFSPKLKPFVRAGMAAPLSPLQQQHVSASPAATAMPRGSLGPGGLQAPLHGAGAPPMLASQSPVAPAAIGGAGVPCTPRPIQPPPVQPQNPPGSHGARMAERFRQAATLLRVHGSPVSVGSPAEPCGAPRAATMHQVGGSPATLDQLQNGEPHQPAVVSAVMGSGCGAGAEAGHTGCTASTLASRQVPAASAAQLHGEVAASSGTGFHTGSGHTLQMDAGPSGTPPRKRARTKAQRLQRLQEQRQGAGPTGGPDAAGKPPSCGAAPEEAIIASASGIHSAQVVHSQGGMHAQRPGLWPAGSAVPETALHKAETHVGKGHSAHANGGLPEPHIREDELRAVLESEDDDGDIQVVDVAPAPYPGHAVAHVIDLCDE
eukprot:jgi/Ulvmu1/1395/UM011_0123.1